MAEDKGMPTSQAEYLERFQVNSEDAACNLARGLMMPCPFCAALHFTKTPVFECTPNTVQPEHVCVECGRGARPVVVETAEGLHFKFYQTRGPKQAPWAASPMEWIM